MNDLDEVKETAVLEKLATAAEYPSFGVDFTPEEAEMAGAFVEDALSVDDVEDAAEDAEVENG